MIIAADETDVTVECMHFIGSKYDCNRFYWPDKIKDICMYSYDNVLTLIPEPQVISDHGRASQHFRVLPAIWEQITCML